MSLSTPRSHKKELVGSPAETDGREQHRVGRPKYKGLSRFLKRKDSSLPPSPAAPPRLPPSRTSCTDPSTPSTIPPIYQLQIPTPPPPISISSILDSRPGPSRNVRARRPRIEVSESEYRPHVPAQLRLSHWTSPASLTHQAELESRLSPEAIAKLNETLFAAFSDATKVNYGAGLAHFMNFCDRENVSEKDRLPASKYLLAAFVADAAGSHRGHLLVPCITR